jgi:hypothetical protein
MTHDSLPWGFRGGCDELLFLVTFAAFVASGCDGLAAASVAARGPRGALVIQNGYRQVLRTGAGTTP